MKNKAEFIKLVYICYMGKRIDNFIPSINYVFAKGNTIIIYFNNGEIKALEKSNLSKDIHTEKISQSEIWKSVKNDKYSVFWPKYKLFNTPYSIGHDTIYDISKPYKEMDVIIKGLRKYKGYTQKDLAQKLKLKPSDLAQIEQGKNTNLKLINQILSIIE